MKLTITTPAGEFNRKTETLYRFANVWYSPRAQRVFVDPGSYRGGVQGRWIKDRGYAVTWHSTERAALAAAKAGYGWDSTATLLGTFPVNETTGKDSPV